MKKALVTLLVTLLVSHSGYSQIYKSVLPSPEFSSALEKIVLDFRLNFSSIIGNEIGSGGDTETFESTVKLPGATDCIIYKYHSKADTTASWQATMYKGEDYKEASKAYENLFRLVKKTKIRWIDKTFVGFNGEMEKPQETLRFAASTLNFELEDKRYKNFQADVELVSNYSGWEVHLNLQTKRPDNANSL